MKDWQYLHLQASVMVVASLVANTTFSTWLFLAAGMAFFLSGLITFWRNP